jgi:hypothetical protein
MLALTAACIVAVLVAVWTRIAHVPGEHTGLRAPATALAVIFPIGLAIFTLAGPLQHGWARRAGTPASLLGRSRSASSSPSSSSVASSGGSAAGSSARPGASPVLTKPFTANLGGTVSERRAAGGAIVELSMRVNGGVHGRLRVRLGGVPVDAGGGLSMTGSQVDLALAGTSSVLEGRIVDLQGEQFLARVSDGGGNVVDLRVNLSIDNRNNTATGTMTGSPAGSGG